MSGKFRVAVLDDYQSAAATMAAWESLPAEVSVDFLHDPIPSDRLAETLAEYSALVAMRERTRFGAELLAALPQLRLLTTTGMRNASIDIDAAHDRGITVCGTRSAQAGPLELTWALILNLVRGVTHDDRELRNGGWQTRMGGNLAGHTLGIVGLGRLGGRMAEVAHVFGMEVQAWSPHLTDERAAAASVRRATKEELFATSDIVSIHLVLSDATRGIVGEPELRAMRPDTFLVNTARSGLIEHDALRQAVEGEWVAGVGLDVFEQEPLPLDSWLRRSNRTLLSPHMGYVTTDNYRAMYGDAVDNIHAYLAGAPIRELDRRTPPV